MPYNLLILPLLAGYYLFANLEYFKFKSKRQQSQRLLLNGALAGVFIAFFAILIRRVVEQIFPALVAKLYPVLNKLIGQSFKDTYLLWTMSFGLLITIILTHTVNWFFERDEVKRANYVIKLVRDYGSELEKMFAECAINQWPIQVTLKNNKVYVGFIDQIPTPSETNYFNLMPLKSGYRDNETKELNLNVEYDTLKDLLVSNGEGEKAEMMIIVIKQDEVLTASPYDHSVYLSFKNG